MPSHSRPTILFIYNANSGLLNGAIDTVHKLLSPGTYSCQLCAITYGHVGMRKDWRQFLESLSAGYEIGFLYKEHLVGDYERLAGTALPAVCLKQGTELSLWISADRLKKMKGQAELIEAVQQCIANAA